MRSCAGGKSASPASARAHPEPRPNTSTMERPRPAAPREPRKSLTPREPRADFLARHRRGSEAIPREPLRQDRFCYKSYFLWDKITKFAGFEPFLSLSEACLSL